MFALFLGKGVLALGQVTPTHVAPTDQASQTLYLQLERIRAFIAQETGGHLVIEAIPMPSLDTTLMRTYTNSVLVNGTALVPRYEKNLLRESPYDGQEHMVVYEQQTETLYRRYGYKVRFLNADDLILRGGALHCVTGHWPRTTGH
jgi:agmatine/peptidylarginine deiminase